MIPKTVKYFLGLNWKCIILEWRGCAKT